MAQQDRPAKAAAAECPEGFRGDDATRKRARGGRGAVPDAPGGELPDTGARAGPRRAAVLAHRPRARADRRRPAALQERARCAGDADRRRRKRAAHARGNTIARADVRDRLDPLAGAETARIRGEPIRTSACSSAPARSTGISTNRSPTSGWSTAAAAPGAEYHWTPLFDYTLTSVCSPQLAAQLGRSPTPADLLEFSAGRDLQ